MVNEDSVFDEDEVRDFIRSTERVRDGLQAEIGKLEAVYTTAVREASLHTENGQPAPVYDPILKALRARIDHAKTQIAQASKNIDADNRLLKKWMRAQQEAAEESGSKFERAAANAYFEELLDSSPRNLSGTSIRGTDGKFHPVSGATAEAIDAGLAADPSVKGYRFMGEDGRMHTAAE